MRIINTLLIYFIDENNITDYILELVGIIN